MQVHHQTYDTRSLLFAFYAAIVTAVVTWSFDSPNALALFRVSVEPLKIRYTDLLVATVAGASCGLLAAAFVRLTFIISRIKLRYITTTLRRVSYAAAVVTLTLSVWFPMGPSFHGTQRHILDSLFTPNSSITTSQLVIYPILKFLATALALNTSLPSGCFAPSFAIGASVGHALGRAIEQSLGASAPDLAMITAAAYTGAVTRTLSPTLLVLELTNRAGDISVATGLAVILFAVLLC